PRRLPGREEHGLIEADPVDHRHGQLIGAEALVQFSGIHAEEEIPGRWDHDEPVAIVPVIGHRVPGIVEATVGGAVHSRIELRVLRVDPRELNTVANLVKAANIGGYRMAELALHGAEVLRVGFRYLEAEDAHVVAAAEGIHSATKALGEILHVCGG